MNGTSMVVRNFISAVIALTFTIFVLVRLLFAIVRPFTQVIPVQNPLVAFSLLALIFAIPTIGVGLAVARLLDRKQQSGWKTDLSVQCGIAVVVYAYLVFRALSVATYGGII